MAIGSAAVTCLGAGTLADIFEVHERGKKVRPPFIDWMPK